MRRKFINFFKITFISFILGVGVTFTVTNFVHNKMEEEIQTYFKLTDDMKELNDIYSLCNGLLSSNPSSENIDSCNFAFNKIKLKVDEIKDKCPYITFYTTYIEKIKY